MKNKRLEKRFIIAVFMGSIANVITLVLWVTFRINPIIAKVENIKKDIFNNEIRLEYNSFDNLQKDIDKTAKK